MTVVNTSDGEASASPAFPLDHNRPCYTGLDAAFMAVREFHKVMGQRAPDTPQMQPEDLVERRAKWIGSELQELRDARSLVDQMDAYLDVIYFGLGGLVELGLMPQVAFEIVHGANMAKVWPDGTVHRREDGKIIKPPEWVAPEPQLAAEVERQTLALPLFE